MPSCVTLRETRSCLFGSAWSCFSMMSPSSSCPPLQASACHMVTSLLLDASLVIARKCNGKIMKFVCLIVSLSMFHIRSQDVHGLRVLFGSAHAGDAAWKGGGFWTKIIWEGMVECVVSGCRQCTVAVVCVRRLKNCLKDLEWCVTLTDVYGMKGDHVTAWAWHSPHGVYSVMLFKS